MAEPWRVEIATLRGDQTLLNATMATGVKFERYIGKAGSFGATLPVPNATIARRLRFLFEAGSEYSLAAYVSRGDKLWCGAILDDPEALISGRAGDSVTLSGRTFEAYPDMRTLDQDLTWSGAEQLEMARQIWQHLTADEGDMGISTPFVTPSGIQRDLTVAFEDKRTLGSILSEISGRANGFEWMIDVQRVAGVRTRTLKLGYPRITSTASTPKVFSYPGAILELGYKRSTSRGGTRFWGIGAAPGDVAGTAQNVTASSILRAEDLLDGESILVDRVLSLTDVTEQTTVDERVGDALERLAHAIPIPTATVRLDRVTPDMLGEKVRLRANHPLFGDGPAGAPAYDQLQRVIGIKVSPTERGTHESAELVFEELTAEET